MRAKARAQDVQALNSPDTVSYNRGLTLISDILEDPHE
jgi:hypothetical protein